MANPVSRAFSTQAAKKPHLLQAGGLSAEIADLRQDVEAGFLAEESDLGSTSSGKGAAHVGIHDAGGFYTMTTVEGALQEVRGQASGTTAQRPSSPFPGQTYYDTTVLKELVWDGSGWVEFDSSPSPTVVGTPGSQLQSSVSFQLVATTTDAAAVTIDTGYAPADGHVAQLDGGYSVVNRTAHECNSGHAAVMVQTFTSVTLAGTPIVSGHVGDSTLSTAVPSFSIVNGTLNVTFTPPESYSGTLDWYFTFDMAEN